ncbi:MAG TPA: DUF1326 domain-containing protein [Candidatus Polarisedimenticolia bacterium]|nr:DUF1326 domain-containing protein [Candidatus Polarisedimenticolia bacterium]
MRTRPASIALLLALSGAALISLAAEAKKAEAPKTPWKLVGQLEEACSCSAACPCWFGSKPTKMTCGGGQVLFIEKGNYGSVPLDGLAVASMGQSPAGKGMMESFGNWDFSYTYLDEKASPEQRQALQAIAERVLPVAASQKKEFRVSPITRAVEGKEHKISLGQYGSFGGHLIEGGLGGSVKITNPPGADPLHHEYQQGQTTAMAYNDAGQNWSFEGSNYMFGTFQIDSAQYEKYAAGLAQKMQPNK